MMPDNVEALAAIALVLALGAGALAADHLGVELRWIDRLLSSPAAARAAGAAVILAAAAIAVAAATSLTTSTTNVPPSSVVDDPDLTAPADGSGSLRGVPGDGPAARHGEAGAGETPASPIDLDAAGTGLAKRPQDTHEAAARGGGAPDAGAAAADAAGIGGAP